MIKIHSTNLKWKDGKEVYENYKLPDILFGILILILTIISIPILGTYCLFLTLIGKN